MRVGVLFFYTYARVLRVDRVAVLVLPFEDAREPVLRLELRVPPVIVVPTRLTARPAFFAAPATPRPTRLAADVSGRARVRARAI